MLLLVVVGQCYSVADLVQQTVIDGFPYVLNRLLRIQRCNDLVLPRADFVGRQDAYLSSCYLFFVDHHRLRYMIHLGLHFGHLSGLKIHQLKKVVRQRVDLVSNAGQRLSGVVFRFLQGSFLIVRTVIEKGKLPLLHSYGSRVSYVRISKNSSKLRPKPANIMES